MRAVDKEERASAERDGGVVRGLKSSVAVVKIVRGRDCGMRRGIDIWVESAEELLSSPRRNAKI